MASFLARPQATSIASNLHTLRQAPQRMHFPASSACRCFFLPLIAFSEQALTQAPQPLQCSLIE
jgi:hypothetical protein